MKQHIGPAISTALVLALVACALLSGCAIGITNSPGAPGSCIGDPARSQC